MALYVNPAVCPAFCLYLVQSDWDYFCVACVRPRDHHLVCLSVHPFLHPTIHSSVFHFNVLAFSFLQCLPTEMRVWWFLGVCVCVRACTCTRRCGLVYACMCASMHVTVCVFLRGVFIIIVCGIDISVDVINCMCAQLSF